MEKYKNKSTNDDINYTIKTDPSDGFVHKKYIDQIANELRKQGKKNNKSS